MKKKLNREQCSFAFQPQYGYTYVRMYTHLDTYKYINIDVLKYRNR